MNDQDAQRRLEVWIHRRKGPLAGAVAAHLANLSDFELERVPFFCDVMVDLDAVLRETIDANAVSLAWRASSSSGIYRHAGDRGHHFCSSFIYVLNELDPDASAMDLAHESPCRSDWIALSRTEKLGKV